MIVLIKKKRSAAQLQRLYDLLYARGQYARKVIGVEYEWTGRLRAATYAMLERARAREANI